MCELDVLFAVLAVPGTVPVQYGTRTGNTSYSNYFLVQTSAYVFVFLGLFLVTSLRNTYDGQALAHPVSKHP